MEQLPESLKPRDFALLSSHVYEDETSTTELPIECAQGKRIHDKSAIIHLAVINKYPDMVKNTLMSFKI